MRPLIALAFALPAHAATLTVGPSGQHATIQAAVQAAAPGDQIQIAAGTYTGPVTIHKAISLVGMGTVILTGQDSSLVTIDHADVTLVNLDLTPDGGRGVRIEGGNVALTNLTITGNSTSRTAFDGAAVWAQDATVVITGSLFQGNRARSTFTPVRWYGQGGHLYLDNAQVTITQSTLDDGRARDGGAIYATGGSTLLVDDTTVSNHSADYRGGGLYLVGGSLTLRDAVVMANVSATEGGGAYVDGAGTTVVTVERTRFEGNQAQAQGSGGGLYMPAGASLSITDSTWSDNSAGRDGGGLYTGALQSTIVASRWCTNAASRDGGSVHATAPLTVRQSAFIGEAAGSDGGAISTTQSGLTVTFSDFLANQASRGAAIDAGGSTLTLTHALIAGHTGVAVRATGGTVHHNGWYANPAGDVTGGLALGTGHVAADPRLPRFVPADLCTADLGRDPASPLRDAGDTGLFDPDGTTADIGIWGGPLANPRWFSDGDMDGVILAYDCNDADSASRPDALELCNGRDNDCDGIIDGPTPVNAGAWFLDQDGDGYGDPSTAISQCDPPEGYVSVGGDCDDTNRSVHPGAAEICDGIDNNCDDIADGADAANQIAWYLDEDGDGFGGGLGTQACQNPGGFVPNGFDCDDSDATISPDAVEVCDGIDRDCDGTVDGPEPIDGLPFYRDADRDGFGALDATPVLACALRDGLARTHDDCDDTSDAIHPRAVESCTAPFTDLNCDGLVGLDDGDRDGFPACEDCDDADPNAYPGAPNTWYDGIVLDCTVISDFDQDGDQFESADHGGEDCLDTNAEVHPGAREVYNNGLDDDCVDGDDPGAPRGTCGCASAAPAGGLVWWIGLGVLALRRRVT